MEAKIQLIMLSEVPYKIGDLLWKGSDAILQAL
jgi:hypothetical protein